MAGLLDNEKLEIECPNCKAKIKKTVKELKTFWQRVPKM